eukprot:1619444-Pleurochrysis_carterae.AAC.2
MPCHREGVARGGGVACKRLELDSLELRWPFFGAHSLAAVMRRCMMLGVTDATVDVAQTKGGTSWGFNPYSGKLFVRRLLAVPSCADASGTRNGSASALRIQPRPDKAVSRCCRASRGRCCVTAAAVDRIDDWGASRQVVQKRREGADADAIVKSVRIEADLSMRKLSFSVDGAAPVAVDSEVAAALRPWCILFSEGDRIELQTQPLSQNGSHAAAPAAAHGRA